MKPCLDGICLTGLPPSGRWKHGLVLPGGGKTPSLKQIYMSCDGQLAEPLWAALEAEFHAPRKAIKHDLAHLAALARGDAAVEKLDSVQQARGIDKAVDRYVDAKLPKRTDKKSKPTKNVNQPHLVEVRCLPILYMPWVSLICTGGSDGRCCSRLQWPE